MALSMDEQRMLAEIERRLAAEDPGLATRLSSFRRSGPAGLRTTRGKIIGSICTVVLLAVIGLTVYAMMPFRAHSAKVPTSRLSSAQPSTSAPVQVGGVTQSTSSGSTAG
ncbi:MAG TPA: DUF3040 domain-containing protein [Trebonia sp.]|jgi:hypothetical protein